MIITKIKGRKKGGREKRKEGRKKGMKKGRKEGREKREEKKTTLGCVLTVDFSLLLTMKESHKEHSWNFNS